jgi:S-adenosylmethionine:tRNA ribosyltransferase-isomerase
MAAAGLIADFTLPRELEASAPPESRGLARDGVRLLVSRMAADEIGHARFRDLADMLAPGDLLVVNTSGTLNAALDVRSERGERFELHLSTELPGRFWSVELRSPGPHASLPFRGGAPGLRLELPQGGEATLLAPYPQAVSTVDRGSSRGSRLWLASLVLPIPLVPYLERFGFPIRYSYVERRWPSSAYQTIFATEAGSAEMPSAGRPFTQELVTRLVSRGVQIAPILLHTGVASLEDHEPPYEEWFRVEAPTAERVNAARRAGRRVIAVGTTVVRALETVTDETGNTSAGSGWTSLVIAPGHRIRSVNGLITGLHEPRATHLTILDRVAAAALASAGCPTDSAAPQLERAYAAARAERYRWHEFGDSHLILPI